MGQFMNPDLFIAGGRPAGLATAIITVRSGLSVVVSDAGHPPIDKACGGGLLPDSLEALPHLGVDLSFVRSFPLHGIRFPGTGSNPQASRNNEAVIKEFHNIVPTAQGKIELSFIPIKDFPLINAVELEQEPPDTQR